MSLDVWLDTHRLGHLGDVLRGAGIDLDILPCVSEQELASININLGDRKRLLRALSGGIPEPASTETPSARPQEAASVRAESGERRQLTVMFCDLVGSTRLSEELDPEDLRAVIQAFYLAIRSAVSAFGGHVEQYLGDGILVFFGYPRAEEDAVTRAVRAAMAAQGALAALEPMPGLRLQCRIGIATGPVVLGALMSESGTVVTGRTPNLAARLQACAEPGQILLAPETARLAEFAFSLQGMPPVELKGIDGDITPWRVLGEHSLENRPQGNRHRPDLIGRDAETALLLQRWSLACDGEPQAVLLSGEAGIGKSCLAEALLTRARTDGARIVVWQCSPHFSSSALWPVARQLERLAGIDAAELPAQRAEKLEQAGIREPLLRQLAGVAEAAASADPISQKIGTEDAVLELLRCVACDQPLLLLVEDAHWIDPSTETLLRRALTELGVVPALILVNSRPEFVPDWGHLPNLTRLGLNRLGNRQAGEVVALVCSGYPLPAAIVEEILRKTDGIPLFIEELTRAVLESDGIRSGPGVTASANRPLELAVPASLQDSLMARLDRLSSTREIAQAGAVIGREFGHRLLAAILRPVSAAQLDAAMEELLRAELVSQRGSGRDAVYVFKHALVRDTAYNSLLRARRAMWHSRVAQGLRELEPHSVAQRPELLAYHLEEAGEHAEAAAQWGLAADSAFARAALPEAAHHIASALALTPHSPASLREEQRLQMLLTHVMTQLEGYGSARGIEAGRRAVELARELGDPNLHIEAACGLGTLLVSCGLVRETVSLFDDVDADSLALLTPARRASRHWILGVAAVLGGSCEQAVSELRQALAAIRETSAWEPGFFLGGAVPEVAILLWCERALESAGFIEQAIACSEQAYAIALQDRHVPTLTWSMQSRATALLSGGRIDEARVLVAQLLELSRRFGIKQRLAAGLILEGHLAVVGQQFGEARMRMEEGFAIWAASSPGLAVTSYAAAVARALAIAQDIDGVSHFLLAGERVMASTQERAAEAELQRLRGWVARQRGNDVEAREYLSSALAIARAQGARVFALRACIDRVHLESDTARRDEAVAALRDAFGGFSEGFSSGMLLEAARLLEATAA